MPRARQASIRRRQLPIVLFVHPFELALGGALVLNGLRGVLGAASPSVYDLPAIPLMLYLVVSTLGGIGVIVGLVYHDPPRHVGLGVAIERASLYLVAASYAGFALLIVANNHAAGVPTGLVALVVAVACILRTVAIRRAARIVLDQLRAVNRTDDGHVDD